MAQGCGTAARRAQRLGGLAICIVPPLALASTGFSSPEPEHDDVRTIAMTTSNGDPRRGLADRGDRRGDGAHAREAQRRASADRQTAEDFVDNEVLPVLDRLEAKDWALARDADPALRRARAARHRRARGARRRRARQGRVAARRRGGRRAARRSRRRSARRPAWRSRRSSASARRHRSRSTCRGW